MSTMVYQFGLLPPTREATHVRAQMRAGHNYRNALTEIERGRRATVREAYEPIRGVELAAATAIEAELAAFAAIKAARSATRSKSESADLKSAHHEAKTVAKAARLALSEARRQLREGGTIAPRMAEIEALAGELRRGARSLTEAHWGTYALIESAADDARSDLPLYDGVEPNDPRFVRWDGEGRVGVQVHQKGASKQGVTLGELRTGIVGEWLRVVPADDRRHGRRAGTRAVLSMRLGTTPEGAPIVAEWPMTMHRPISPSSVVRSAVVSCRMIGARERWTVQLTVQRPEQERACGPEGSFVTVNDGWRAVDGGLRVGTWLGSDAATGTIVLPERILSAANKVRELRSIRDDNFNAMTKRLSKWMGERNVPAWLQHATMRMAQWRAKPKLVRAWRECQRHAGDEKMYAALDVWRRQDKHLWDWESSQAKKLELHRRELYRVFAADMARRYETVVFGDVDRSKIIKERTNDQGQRNRQIAAPSELIEALRNAFSMRGGFTSEVSAVDVSHACHACGVVDAFDAAVAIHHVCTGCGERWDQDANACIVYRERYRDALPTAIARRAKSLEKTLSKWQKRAAKKEESATARKAPADAAE